MLIDFKSESHRRAGRGLVYVASALLIIPLLVAMISGCQLLDKGTLKAASHAAQALIFYCEQTDQHVRDQFQMRLSERLSKKGAPYSLTAQCDLE